jgi:hypothetical protein
MRNLDVDAWFAAKQHPLEDAMQAVRDIALAADSRISESIKWSTPTYSYQGNIFSFNPAKKFVSLLFHTGAQIPGAHPGLEGEGDTARVMRFSDLDDVRQRSGELNDILQAWCRWKDGEEAGGG